MRYQGSTSSRQRRATRRGRRDPGGVACKACAATVARPSPARDRQEREKSLRGVSSWSLFLSRWTDSRRIVATRESSSDRRPGSGCRIPDPPLRQRQAPDAPRRPTRPRTGRARRAAVASRIPGPSLPLATRRPRPPGSRSRVGRRLPARRVRRSRRGGIAAAWSPGASTASPGSAGRERSCPRTSALAVRVPGRLARFAWSQVHPGLWDRRSSSPRQSAPALPALPRTRPPTTLSARARACSHQLGLPASQCF